MVGKDTLRRIVDAVRNGEGLPENGAPTKTLQRERADVVELKVRMMGWFSCFVDEVADIMPESTERHIPIQVRSLHDSMQAWLVSYTP